MHWGVIVFLLAIFLSIALHEFGHLYFTRKYGCRVSQYAVGFGPTLPHSQQRCEENVRVLAERGRGLVGGTLADAAIGTHAPPVQGVASRWNRSASSRTSAR
ncbi:hypothetical protein F1D05_09775 [Kribbella qitaiheensis]|uniref:Peptidase M50 domain-containing protein n=1 Tax=Kribbella qitaiheensis TaxID=1544730 RepID=A0A7G6WVW0_9ACTN|nr:hypothetical protein F1D05_09775 [Kribbella qitaiheensis]